MPLVREVLKNSTEMLEAKGIQTPRLDAEILLANALGTPRENLLTRWDETVTLGNLKKFEALLGRRTKREPVARITGVQEFWSLPFKINQATLVPRPDSETLVEAVLKKIPEKGDPKILDLGTGSGCLLLSILSMRNKTSGLGVDANQPALECARENAKNLGLQDRAAFKKFDWMVDDPIDQKFDLIISNPPYIESDEISELAPEVSKFDPRAALDGGVDGLDCYRKIIPLSQTLFADGGGWLFLEIGETQQTQVETLMKKAGFTKIEIHHDLVGKPRVLAGFSG